MSGLQRDNKRDLFDYLESRKGRIIDYLSGGADIDLLMSSVYSAMSKTPKLVQCDRESIFRAVCDAAKLGLEVGGPHEHGNIVPYGSKAQWITQYKGLIHLARREGVASHIRAKVVRAGDVFVHNEGTSPCIVHELSKSPNAKWTDVYAIAWTKGAPFPEMVSMSREQLEEFRAQYGPRNKSGPWWGSEHEFIQMCKKTLIKQVFKLVDLSTNMAAALQDETAAREGRSIFDFTDPVVEDIAPPETDSKSELAEALTAQIAQEELV